MRSELVEVRRLDMLRERSLKGRREPTVDKFEFFGPANETPSTLPLQAFTKII
jgi:hypothetical protein